MEANKLRSMADGLQKQIDDKCRDMTQNPTPKRNREYAIRRIEGQVLIRAQRAMRALADLIESGEALGILADVKTKADILKYVKTRTGSNGYYDIHDTLEWSDNSTAAIALRRIAELEKAPKADTSQELKNKIAMDDLPGFWPTPDDVCDQLVEMAEIDSFDLTVLEPSCGWGSIADAIVRACPGIRRLDCIEWRDSLAQLAAKAHAVQHDDFLSLEPPMLYDRIVMNPPFEKGQDVEHVTHAMKWLKPGGRLVSIISRGTNSRSDRKTTAFRGMVEEFAGEITDLDDNAFNRAGQVKRTSVSCSVVVIDKPAEKKASVLPKLSTTLRQTCFA